MTQIKKEKLYCEDCGAEMKSMLKFAENFVDIELWKEVPTTLSNSKYDKKTGKRNYIMGYICPNKKWYNINKHDKYAKGKLITK